jgi:hypothetical protein
MKDQLSRFAEKFALSDDPDGCWQWTAAKGGKGYGRFGKVYAHRFSYATFVGEIGPNLCVCHTCDNRACVNPNHMFLGTNADNLADMRAKGRDSKPPLIAGEASPRAKLTEAIVRDIRASNLSYAENARRYGVTTAAVRFACTGRTWKHVK